MGEGGPRGCERGHHGGRDRGGSDYGRGAAGQALPSRSRAAKEPSDKCHRTVPLLPFLPRSSSSLAPVPPSTGANPKGNGQRSPGLCRFRIPRREKRCRPGEPGMLSPAPYRVSRPLRNAWDAVFPPCQHQSCTGSFSFQQYQLQAR